MHTMRHSVCSVLVHDREDRTIEKNDDYQTGQNSY